MDVQVGRAAPSRFNRICTGRFSNADRSRPFITNVLGCSVRTGSVGTAGANFRFSFSVLSVLPAVLLHISLRSRSAALWITGYAVSGIAVILHIIDLLTGASRFHYAAILLVTIGFAVLTATSVAREAWSGEAAVHHAGIPLAIFVLLQDYRFLLLDAFIRFLVNGSMAALAI